VPPKLFTPAEVNALIPRLESLVGRMQRCGEELRRALQEAIADDGRDSIGVGELLELRPDLEPLAREIESLLREVEGTGGRFKGLELGLVDYLAEVEGERVLLCWQYGESEVGFYHPLGGGFAARQPLPRTRPRVLQ
jgi:hypothetical protein